MTDPWRVACPEDHRDVIPRRGSIQTNGTHWYCRTCRERYDRVRDLKENRDVRVRQALR